MSAQPRILALRRRGGVWAFSALLVVFIVASRWALAPRYLYYFDSANFAYSLEDFNPALHQPQPPGYPLFVGLIRLIHLWVDPPQTVLLIAGLLAACAAVLLIRILAADLFGPAAGILAAVMLASGPVFWFGGITNQIRLFLSLSAVGIGVLAWRTLIRPGRPGWFYATCAALGIAGGFRPGLALLLIPLLAWVWIETGRSPRRLGIGALCCAVCALPWIAVTVLAVGGIRHTGEVLWSYSRVQFQGTSVLYGAAPRSAAHMFAAAVEWNLLGALVWIWAVPFLKGRVSDGLRRKITFLALGFLPPFLFSAFVHIGDPDQALASISILTVAGGGVLAAYLQRFAGRGVYVAAVAVVAVHVLLFFKPPTKLAKAASYKAAAATNRLTTRAIESVRDLRAGGPLTIVHYGSPMPSRELSYYFPDDYVVILPAGPGEWPMSFYHHRLMPIPPGAAGLIRPGSRRVVLFAPEDRLPTDLLKWRKEPGFSYLETEPDATLSIGPYRIVPEPQQPSESR